MPSNALRLSAKNVTGELAEVLARMPAKLGIEREFPAAVLAEAEAIARNHVLPDADSTSIPFVTIDPAESMDLDQALHLERDGAGYRVWYAIADVPSFVAPGGALDAESRKRGQTIYAPDGRIPLHPPVLSEGAASLLPGELRGAFVWSFELDAAAIVTAVTVSRARVTSREKLNYVGVQRALDDGSASVALSLLKEVGIKRTALEAARGGASLQLPETEVASGADGYSLERRKPLAVENWNAQLSLMTGMAAAEIMLKGGVGILRTMPPAEQSALDKFRRQTIALGHPWQPNTRYGDFLRELDTSDPQQLAIMHDAGALFRGAGYTPFDGAPPAKTEQGAVGAPYAHATAPLRRLVDRFVLVVCEALCAGNAVPEWAREALPSIPGIMASSGALAGQLDRAAIDAIEAAILTRRVGETFPATVVSSNDHGGTIQLVDPAVTARCDGVLTAGTEIVARLETAEIASGTVQFTVVT